MVSWRPLAIATAVLMLGALATPTVANAAKDYRADRYDVVLVVEPGGSMLVTERIRFVFGNDTFKYVLRGLPSRRTDGVTILSVSMDGRVFVPGDESGQFEVEKKDNTRRLLWHFSPVTASTHTFELVYRVAGVVRYEPAEDLLEWHALPTNHEYSINCASLEVTAPVGASLVEAAAMEPPSTSTSDTGPMRFSRCGFGKDDSWLLRARFSPRSLVAAQPDWQRRAALADQKLPLFLGLGGMILLAGLSGFAAFAMNHRPPVQNDPRRLLPEPPDALPANLGAVLAHAGAVTWATGLATLLDLADRRIVRIEEIGGHSLFRKQDFLITPRQAPSSLRPSERAFYDLLFTSKSGMRSSITFSAMAKVLAKKSPWKLFVAAIKGELRQCGFIDHERERTRGRVTVAGIAIAGFGVVGVIAAVPFVREYGGATLSIGISLLAVGITGLCIGQSLTPLTDDAARRAGRWQAYGRHLKQLPQHATPASVTPDAFTRALPFAVAFGAALPWATALAKNGVTAGPAWLHVVPREGADGGHMAATVAMLSAGRSAGGAVDHGGAGASASGAAGGGTSGAG